MNKKPAMPVYPVNVAILPNSGFVLALRADEQARLALAHAAGVTEVSQLEADLVFRRWRRDGVEVTGQIRAKIEQPCVISLEPVFQDIREPVKLTFIPENSKLSSPVGRADRELVLDPEGEDPPDTFVGDSIDAWPIVLEMLLLAIDPFPRSPQAAVSDEAGQPAEMTEENKKSPFLVLQNPKKLQN